MSLEHLRMYPGGDTVAEVFAKIVGGDNRAYTVFHGLETAIKRFEDIADEMRGYATAIVCDNETIHGPIGIVVRLVEQFDRQVTETSDLLALLRGDNEPCRQVCANCAATDEGGTALSGCSGSATGRHYWINPEED